ncbi:MAG: helix-turn-helix domain-containing protein [Pseudomonadota bacterium]
MDTFDLIEASKFLKMHPEEVRKRVKQGRLPGAKIGRAWVFLEDDLANFIRSNYSHPRQALEVTLRKETQSCHSLNAVIPGGSASRPHRESSLDALLKQQTKPKRSMPTT